MPADIDLDRAVIRANPALYAARRIGHDDPLPENLAALLFLSEKVF
jgi:hypothetical protein